MYWTTIVSSGYKRCMYMASNFCAMTGLARHPNGSPGKEYTCPLTPILTVVRYSGGTLQDQNILLMSSLVKYRGVPRNKDRVILCVNSSN